MDTLTISQTIVDHSGIVLIASIMAWLLLLWIVKRYGDQLRTKEYYLRQDMKKTLGAKVPSGKQLNRKTKEKV